jgi:hypothetical protein
MKFKGLNGTVCDFDLGTTNTVASAITLFTTIAEMEEQGFNLLSK